MFLECFNITGKCKLVMMLINWKLRYNYKLNPKRAKRNRTRARDRPVYINEIFFFFFAFFLFLVFYFSVGAFEVLP